jgi:putative colanic acid biosynthesis glycosyltransferase
MTIKVPTVLNDHAPLFSVITICFNNVAGLRKTQLSIESQTCTDYEWIIVDGNSSDGTVEYLNRIRSNKTRFISEADSGIYDAMSKGLNLARGEYVIFMNSGDIFAEDNVLDCIRTTIGTDRPKLIYGDSYEQEGDMRFYKPARAPASNSYVMFTHHQSIFYARSVAIKVGFDNSYKISGDWVMTGRVLAQAGNHLLGVPFAVSTFERGGVSQSKKYRRLINREHIRIYREEHRHSQLKSSLFWLKKVAVNKLREVLPGLYDRLRYRSAPNNQVSS